MHLSPRVLCARLVTVTAVVLTAVLVPLTTLPVPAHAATTKALTADGLPALKSDAPANTAQIPAGDFSNPPPSNVVKNEGTSHFDANTSKIVNRDATTNVYQNVDGSQTADISQVPVNAQDNTGKWRPIDNTLAKQADGRIHNGFGALDTSLAGNSTDAKLVTVTKGSNALSFGLGGASANTPAETKDNTVTYTNILPATDLRYQVTSQQLTETIVINAKPTNAPVYVFNLTAPGLTAMPQDNGSYQLVDKSGTTAFTIQPSYAWDSSSTELNVTHRVAAAVSADGTKLIMTPDPTWLADPDTVYPVRIDPTVLMGLGADDHTTANDAPVESYLHTQNFNGSGQYYPNSKYQNVAGKNTGGTQFLTQMWFNLADLQSKQIDYATLKLYTYDNNQSGTAPLCIYPTSQSWNENTLTWDSQPSHLGNCNVSTDPDKITAGQSAMPAGNFSNIDITSWVRKWTDGTRANYGMTFDSAGQSGLYHFGATENRLTGGDAPYISVDYQVPASQPTGPTNGDSVMTSTPTLTSTTVTDPNEPIQYWYRVSNTTNPESGMIINSGWQGSPTYTVPAGSLQDGVTYSWYVLTKDGGSGSYNVSSTWTFKVNLRMGQQSVSPMDSEGPASVNLANGNMTLSTSSPSFTTAGGSAGVSYTYNSQLPSNKGLTARYYPGCITNNASYIPGNVTDPYIVRRESVIDLNYTSGPGPSVPQNSFCASFDGYITPPSGSGYQFDLANDDGAQLTVGGALLTNNWTANQVTSTPAFANGTQFVGGTPIPVRISWYNGISGAYLQLWAKTTTGTSFVVPASWLSVSAQPLSPGWQLSVADGAGAMYASATYTPNSVILNGTDGTLTSTSVEQSRTITKHRTLRHRWAKATTSVLAPTAPTSTRPPTVTSTCSTLPVRCSQ